MTSNTDHLRKWQEDHARVQPGPPRNPAQRWRDKDTRKTAIDAFCWECMGGDEEDGVRELIRTCVSGPGSINPCPLWGWRPYR
jgi:hypothetical protein